MTSVSRVAVNVMLGPVVISLTGLLSREWKSVMFELAKGSSSYTATSTSEVPKARHKDASSQFAMGTGFSISGYTTVSQCARAISVAVCYHKHLTKRYQRVSHRSDNDSVKYEKPP
jgi:hypothetical protein